MSRRTRATGLFLLRTGQQVPSLVRSIQRGTISIAAGSTSNTGTLSTAVSLANARLVYLGTDDQSADTTPNIVCCRITLTDATTVTATVNSTGAGARVVSYEVIEYWPGVIKSVQRSTFATTASESGTGTITSVNTAKATVDLLGFSTTFAGGTVVGQALGSLVLTNATTLTFDGLGAQNRTVSYQVIEWF